MRERGDLIVLHEPFMYHFYLTTKDRLFPKFTPEPGHPRTYAEISAMILAKARSGPVFFKDMAYYLVGSLSQDREFAAQMTHAFLIRDPAEAAVSYAKLDPQFTRTELGYEAQCQLYDALIGLGHAPLILTADQLRSDPVVTLHRYWEHAGLDIVGNAFAWDDKVPLEWKSVRDWHQKVLQSGGIYNPVKSDASAELRKLGAPYTDYVSHHLPYYAKLLEIAKTQEHQK